MDKIGLSLPGLIAQFVNFGILLFVLWQWVIPPVRKMLDTRRERIEESLAAADRMRAQASDAEREVQARIEEGRTEARQLVEQAQGIANRIREDAQVQAQSEIEQMRARALADIELQRDSAIAQLRREFADITINAAEKVINQSLDKSAHQRLIQDVLAESAVGGNGTGKH